MNYFKTVTSPILKKPGADPNSFNNFQTFSNLHFSLKYLKELLQLRYMPTWTTTISLKNFSVVFTPFTVLRALVKITYDLLMAADFGLLTILVRFDLSAAFTTISHNMLDRLASFGVIGTSLVWFQYFLSGHTQFVQLKNFRSKSFPVSGGVPQGSVLAPLLFIIYLLPHL